MAWARSLEPTFTSGAVAASLGCAIQPATVVAGSCPCQPWEPVMIQTCSRARVSRGMVRPSCCTGIRRRLSTSGTAAARAEESARRARRAFPCAAASRAWPKRVKSTTIMPAMRAA